MQGADTMSAIATELGLSVSRISRLIASFEEKGKT
jgi:DNA-binding MarR family transcriptional regulator